MGMYEYMGCEMDEMESEIFISLGKLHRDETAGFSHGTWRCKGIPAK